MFSLFRKKDERVYLDYAAAAPIRPEVISEMNRFFSVQGNPGSLHADGVQAKKALANLRERAAQALHCRTDEIIFTSGGTESNNLAIRGVVVAFRKQCPDIQPHIITSRVEHASVLETCRALETEGLADVSYVGIDEKGCINMKELKEFLSERTVLVSIIHANNEIGTIQDISEIAKTIRHFKKYTKGDAHTTYPLLHTDAAQSFQYIDIHMNAFPVDLMTVNASKLGGPRGAALLFVRKNTPLVPILYGGTQEYGLRPGTEDVALIAGFVKALECSVLERNKEADRLVSMQEYFFGKARERFGERLRINGSREERIPNNINITLKNFESELLVIMLDAKGISVSSKSACNESAGDETSVITELYPTEDARIGGLRITMGRDTKAHHLDRLINALEDILLLYKDFPNQTV